MKNMKIPHRLLALPLLVLALALVMAACAEDPLVEQSSSDDDSDNEQGQTADAGDDEVVVGSANFPESQTLAHVYAIALDDAGVNVTTQLNIGSREVYFPALLGGEIDLLPEYVGSLLNHLRDGTDLTGTEELLEALREDLAAEGVAVLEPSHAENRNALVVKPELADERDLRTTSDLLPHADDLVLGGAPETRERPDGLPGYKEVYGLEFGEFVDLDAGGPLTIGALENDDVDVARLFTSMAVIAERGWVVLEDDGGLIPAENIIPVIREDARSDEVDAALAAVQEALTLEELTGMNERVEIDNEDPDLVAEDWLAEQGLIE